MQFEFCGGFSCEPKKIILGGPMMGISVQSADYVVVKGTSGILCLNEKDAKSPEPSACIRCGRCVDACPFNLMPTEIEHAFEKNDGAMLDKLKVNLCMECGACAFACPAKHKLVEVHKQAKSMLTAYRQTQSAGAGKNN